MQAQSETVKTVDFTSSPQRLFIDADLTLTRGARELRPKRIEQAKVVASLARPLAYGARRQIDRIALFLAASSLESEQSLSLLNDFDRVSIGSEFLSNFLEQIMRPDIGLCVVSAIGDGGALPDQAFASLATSLSSLSTSFERRIARRLIDAAPRKNLARVLVEEKPGKILSLAIEEQTVQLRVKQWSAQLARHGVKAEPPQAFEGFGLAALRVSTHAEDIAATSRRSVLLAGASLRFAEPSLQMYMIDELWAATAHKLALWQAPPLNKLGSIYVSVPSFSVAGYLEERLKASVPAAVDLLVPDLLYGWAPMFTGIELLTRAALPAILLDASRFPAVRLMAVW